MFSLELNSPGDSLEWSWQINLIESEFIAFVDSLDTLGFRMTDLEFDENKRLFACVCIKDDRKWSWVINRTEEEFSSDLDNQEGRPINLLIYPNENGTDLLFGGVWVENPDGFGIGRILDSNKGGFELALSIFGFAGLRLIDFETFHSDGELRYSGFLVADGKKSDLVLAVSSKTDFQNEIENMRNANKRPFSFEMATDFMATAVEENPEEVKNFTLFQNYPNPFNPETNISFELHHAAKVKIEVLNMLGLKIATLTDEFFPAGFHILTWNARDNLGQHLPSGIYLLRVQAGHILQTRKMMVLK